MPKPEPKYGGISSEAVRAKTGRDWDEWLRVLDGEKAQKLPHKEIAILLSDKYRVPPWWSQMVTVGYEQARGLREVHQKSDGYSASASKTFNVSLAKLSAACMDDTLRTKWMGRKTYTVNKATPNKSMRIAWGKDGASRVDFYLTAKDKSKSLLAVEHTKLVDAGQVETVKAYWRGALDKLAKLLSA